MSSRGTGLSFRGKGIRARALQAALASFLIAGPITGCFSNDLRPATRTPDSTRDGSTELPSGTDQSFGVVIRGMVRSSTDPFGSFDVLGNGNGTFSQYCASTTSGQGGYGPTTCKCVFTFLNEDGAVNVRESETTYRESDLLRCPSSAVPDYVTELKVKIKVAQTDSFSNEVVFDFGASGPYGDLNNPDNYVKVQRYQCRDAVFVSYMLDRSIYDPIASEDAELSFPLNFYTSNFAGSIKYFLQNKGAAPAGGSGWICPPIPNDPRAGMDRTIYSLEPLRGSRRIYPEFNPQNNRTDFHLARNKGGVFTVPVNALIAPNTSSVTPSTQSNLSANSPPLGYGAPASSPESGESCPSANVPGFNWVKLWLFRGSLEVRNVASSPAIESLQAISCNPGMYNGQPTFPGCGSGSSPYGFRVLGSNVNRCYNFIKGRSSTVAPGGDTWNVILPLFSAGGSIPDACSYPPGSPLRKDPMNLCGANPAAPRDNEVRLEPLDSASRSDFIFVVTPTNIVARDFLDNTVASRPYRPFRFYSTLRYCPEDPANPIAPARDPVAAGCMANQNKIINYDIKQTDINADGDAPGNDPQRRAAFPVCVLQPTGATTP